MNFSDALAPDDNRVAEQVFRDSFATHYGAIHKAITALPGATTGHDGCDISSSTDEGWCVSAFAGFGGEPWEFRMDLRSKSRSTCAHYGYFHAVFSSDGALLSWELKP